MYHLNVSNFVHALLDEVFSIVLNRTCQNSGNLLPLFPSRFAQISFVSINVLWDTVQEKEVIISLLYLIYLYSLTYRGFMQRVQIANQ